MDACDPDDELEGTATVNMELATKRVEDAELELR